MTHATFWKFLCNLATSAVACYTAVMTRTKTGFTRDQTISATDITNCLRGIVYKKQKKEAPPLHPELMAQFNLFRTFGETGQAIQNRLTAFWKKKGSLVSSGDFIPSEEYGFTGRYDTICKIGNKLVLYEIKGAGKSFFEKVRESKEPRDYHKVQLMIYHRSLLQQYPDIEPRLLYVSRSIFRGGKLMGVEIPVHYTDDEFQNAMSNAELVRKALVGEELPPAVPAIEMYEGKNMVSMNAMMCRHHALCLDNDHWYEDTKRELGLPMEEGKEPDANETVTGDDLPF